MVSKLEKLVAKLAGKKTYVVSLVTAADGVLQLVQGHKWAQVLPFLLAGAFGGAIRAAVSKVEAKVDKVAPVAAPLINAAVAKAEAPAAAPVATAAVK